MGLPEIISPERWLLQVFSARAAREGGVVRRRRRDIERIVGWEVFAAELRRRGYRAVEKIRWEGAYWRTDIGRKALARSGGKG